MPALRPLLSALVAQGFRIAPPLVREALTRVGERELGSAPETEGA